MARAGASAVCTRRCPAPGCEVYLLPGLALCRLHREMLPRELRHRLGDGTAVAEAVRFLRLRPPEGRDPGTA